MLRGGDWEEEGVADDHDEGIEPGRLPRDGHRETRAIKGVSVWGVWRNNTNHHRHTGTAPDKQEITHKYCPVPRGT